MMETERNLGRQPIAAVMEQRGLRAHDLVEASIEQITHKMVQRAIKGRRLTENTKSKVVAALRLAAGHQYTVEELFNY